MAMMHWAVVKCGGIRALGTVRTPLQSRLSTSSGRFFSTAVQGSAAAFWKEAGKSPVVCAEWAAEHRRHLKVVDASWSIGQKEQPPPAVPGAVPFNIDEIAWKDTWLPHMLPSEEEFEGHMNRLGIGSDDCVVIGDRSKGQFVASARAWWMFRVFGHTNVKVLSGGFEDWPEGLQANEDGSASPFKSDFHPELVKDKHQILQMVGKGDGNAKEFIVDARSKARFYAEVAEPRPDVPSGSIPDSINIPFSDLLYEDEKGVQRLHPPEELRGVLKNKPYDITRPITASCGTGVTACVLALGYFAIGKERVSVYDGSWTEYGLDPSAPKVVRRDPENIKDAIARGDVRHHKVPKVH